MTNRDLLQTPELLLGELDRQRRYLLRIEGTSVPCAACKKPVNAFEAAGIDLDAFDFGHTQYVYRCPACAAELEQVVPLYASGGGLWHWQLSSSWLQGKVRKPKAFDQQAEPPEGSPSA